MNHTGRGVRGLIAAALAWAGAAAGAHGQDIGPPISELTRGQAEALWKGYGAPDVSGPSLAPVWPARVERNGARWLIADVALPILKPSGIQLGQFRELSLRDDPMTPGDRDLLRTWLGDADAPIEFEGDNAFCMVMIPEDPAPQPGAKPLPRARRHDGVQAFRVISLREVTGDEARLEVQRTWFSLFMPLGENEAVLGVPVVRGVVLLMPGLFATPEGTLDRLTTTLRKRGLAVLRMWAQPSRFTQRLEFAITPEDGLGDDAARIASAMDDRTAECAFAARAAFEHVEKARPELARLPRAAIGFSGGAMTLPTVLALEPTRYAAAVMVGGGACFWQMNETSNYRTLIDAVRASWPEGSRTDERARELRTLVLGKSSLDSFHTAASLREAGTRMLVVQGILDEAVPAPLGDVLWERLGKPPRLLLEAGHETLFMQLPRHMDEMVRTIDAGFEKVAAGGAGGGGQEQGPR